MNTIQNVTVSAAREMIKTNPRIWRVIVTVKQRYPSGWGERTDYYGGNTFAGKPFPPVNDFLDTVLPDDKIVTVCIE